VKKVRAEIRKSRTVIIVSRQIVNFINFYEDYKLILNQKFLKILISKFKS